MLLDSLSGLFFSTSTSPSADWRRSVFIAFDFPFHMKWTNLGGARMIFFTLRYHYEVMTTSWIVRIIGFSFLFIGEDGVALGIGHVVEGYSCTCLRKNWDDYLLHLILLSDLFVTCFLRRSSSIFNYSHFRLLNLMQHKWAPCRSFPGTFAARI